MLFLVNKILDDINEMHPPKEFISVKEKKIYQRALDDAKFIIQRHKPVLDESGKKKHWG